MTTIMKVFGDENPGQRVFAIVDRDKVYALSDKNHVSANCVVSQADDRSQTVYIFGYDDLVEIKAGDDIASGDFLYPSGDGFAVTTSHVCDYPLLQALSSGVEGSIISARWV